MENPEIYNAVKALVKPLRPEIHISVHNPFKEKPGTFQSIDLYWDETYMDNHVWDKFPIIQEKLDGFVKTLPKYASHEFGASDGHFYCYVTFNP